MKTYQKGSAEIIVIVVLTLAIVGLVGYVAYDKFFAKPDKESSETTEVKKNDTVEDASKKVELVTVDDTDYSFVVPSGFEKTDVQQFTTTGSLTAKYSYVNDKTGDYIEILNPEGLGGGIDSDKANNFTVVNNKLVIAANYTCTPGNPGMGCSTSDESYDVINRSSQETKYDNYYFAYGNKTSTQEANSQYFDEFVDSFRFKA